MSDVTPIELDTLKSRFRSVGYKITDVDKSSFEILGVDLPVRTHVLVTHYYLEFGTVIVAVPRGFLSGRRSKLDAYLSDINLAATLVKFTVDTDRPDTATGGWPIVASVKFVTGFKGADYDASALENLAMLWFQDLAALLASPGEFELHAMMQPSNDNGPDLQ